MATYSINTTALALNASRKRVENILSRYAVPSAPVGRQGKARRLSKRAVATLAVVLQLQEELGVPVQAAVELAASLFSASGDGAEVTMGAIRISVDVEVLERTVGEALSEAVLMAPRPRRGRPPTGR